jgi:hypothetical protein
MSKVCQLGNGTRAIDRRSAKHIVKCEFQKINIYFVEQLFCVELCVHKHLFSTLGQRDRLNDDNGFLSDIWILR